MIINRNKIMIYVIGRAQGPMGPGPGQKNRTDGRAGHACRGLSLRNKNAIDKQKTCWQNQKKMLENNVKSLMPRKQ